MNQLMLLSSTAPLPLVAGINSKRYEYVSFPASCKLCPFQLIAQKAFFMVDLSSFKLGFLHRQKDEFDIFSEGSQLSEVKLHDACVNIYLLQSRRIISFQIQRLGPVKSKRTFRWKRRLQLQGWGANQATNQQEASTGVCLIHVAFLAYSRAQKMEATWCFEMSVEFQRTIWSYVPEDRTVLTNKQTN